VFLVRCTKCKAYGSKERCEADAIHAWNTRAEGLAMIGDPK
jgi:hypothetical protein